MLANRLPENVHLIVASRDRFLPAAEVVRLGARVYQIGTEQLRLNHTELAVYAHRCGTELSDAQVERLLYSSEGWFSAVYLNLRTLSERGVLPSRHSDIYATFTAAMIDPLPEKQREFLAVMGLADEFTVEMARFVTGDADADKLLAALTAQNAFVTCLPDGVTYRFHHMMKECAEQTFLTLPQAAQVCCRERLGAWYEEHRQYIQSMSAYWKSGNYDAALRVVKGCGHPARIPEPADGTERHGSVSHFRPEGASAGASCPDAQYVQLAECPQNAGAEGAFADCHPGAPGALFCGAGQPAGRV